MKSLFHSADRLRLKRRLDELKQDTKATWGRMDCQQMLAHLSDGIRMALGELPVRSRGGPLRFPPLRHAIIYWLPFPKGAPTAPELLARRAESCKLETAALKTLMERFAARTGTGPWPEHPAFGRLTEQDWGALVHKHIDHHLRQFGV